jgi:hypothetical protein
MNKLIIFLIFIISFNIGISATKLYIDPNSPNFTLFKVTQDSNDFPFDLWIYGSTFNGGQQVPRNIYVGTANDISGTIPTYLDWFANSGPGNYQLMYVDKYLSNNSYVDYSYDGTNITIIGVSGNLFLDAPPDGEESGINFGPLLDGLNNILNWLQQKYSDFMAWIESSFNEIVNWLTSIYQWLMNIHDAIVQFFAEVGEWWTNLWEFLTVTMWVNLGNALKSFAVWLFIPQDVNLNNVKNFNFSIKADGTIPVPVGVIKYIADNFAGIEAYNLSFGDGIDFWGNNINPAQVIYDNMVYFASYLRNMIGMIIIGAYLFSLIRRFAPKVTV